MWRCQSDHEHPTFQEKLDCDVATARWLAKFYGVDTTDLPACGGVALVGAKKSSQEEWIEEPEVDESEESD
jgi:hypothetical protein